MSICTLQEIKDWLKITDNSQDAILGTVQAAIERAVINYCEQDFTEHTITNEVLDGNSSDVVVPKHWPITSVQQLMFYITPDGQNGSAIDPSNYTVGESAVYLANGMITPSGRSRVRIDYKAGYTSTPPDVKLAVQMGVEAFMARRQRKSIGIASRGKEGESESFVSAWDKKVGLPVEVVGMLGSYKSCEIPTGTATRGQ